MAVAELIDTKIDHLIDEINELDTRFSIETKIPCKHCGTCHNMISVDCGTVVFWWEEDTFTENFKGRRVTPPLGAIDYEDWIRRAS